MNQELSQDIAMKPKGTTEGINILDLLIIVGRSKRLVCGIPLFATLIAVVISLTMTPVYRASVVLMPPQQPQSGALALLSQLGGAAGMAAGAAGIKNVGELYIGMLKSRNIADAIVKRFDLFKVYDLTSGERVRRQLEKNTAIDVAKSGLISVTVEDEGKQRVAEMANAYVDELVRLTKVLAVTEAGQRRMFYEQQLKAAKENLASAEMELKRSLDTRGVVSVDSESQAMLATMARLKAQISAKEIELNSLRSFITESNPQFRKVQEELSSLRAELSRLENGSVGEPDSPGAAKGLENIKVLRNVKYNQMLYELLAKQYEAARLDEARDMSTIQILDPAIEPEKRAKPQRALLVLSTFAISFLMTVLLVLLRSAVSKATSNGRNKRKITELRATFFRWK